MPAPAMADPQPLQEIGPDAVIINGRDPSWNAETGEGLFAVDLPHSANWRQQWHDIANPRDAILFGGTKEDRNHKCPFFNLDEMKYSLAIGKRNSEDLDTFVVSTKLDKDQAQQIREQGCVITTKPSIWNFKKFSVVSPVDQPPKAAKDGSPAP